MAESEYQNYIEKLKISELLLSFISSPLVIAITAAIAGALIGGVITIYLSDKSKRREDTLNELRNIQSVVVIAFNICNSMLNFKEQTVLEVSSNYEHDKMAFLKHISVSPETLFMHKTDIRRIIPPVLLIDDLLKFIFERVTLSSRPISLAYQLKTAYSTLEKCIESRDLIIDVVKAHHDAQPTNQSYNIIFSIPLENGVFDETMASSMKGINDFTNDLIFYSYLLCEDLNSRAKALKTKYKKLGGEIEEEFEFANFDRAKQKGLLPDNSRYESWLKAFRKKN